jgi:coenzyme F420-reducing hydrogenase alpha subunit
VFARGIEVLQAIDEAIRVIDGFEPPPPLPDRPIAPGAGVGHAATEAPRGILYVSVEADPDGNVAAIRIVPPTSQNQRAIEDDLRELAPRVLDLPEAEARRTCEAAIRDYDPCISCATHFLRLTVERREGS